jgi:hypothetical protein
MPGRACAWLKGDVTGGKRRLVGCCELRVDPGRAREVRLRALPEGRDPLGKICISCCATAAPLMLAAMDAAINMRFIEVLLVV